MRREQAAAVQDLGAAFGSFVSVYTQTYEDGSTTSPATTKEDLAAWLDVKSREIIGGASRTGQGVHGTSV